MRGREQKSEGLFSYVRLEERIARDHPLRAIRALTDEVLALMNASFEAIYSDNGRPSIPPELLLRATLLQAFFSVRSERQLMDQIDYNLLFRWFVGLRIELAHRGRTSRRIVTREDVQDLALARKAGKRHIG